MLKISGTPSNSDEGGLYENIETRPPVLQTSKGKRGEVPIQNCSKLMLDGQVAK
ncbi:hypothetical protein SAMN05421510_102738 [Nitrosomonas ureae]|uniref:Uncharacterized protein n=1 Tax=Nitrosomonas ureae TaxID=44577 RepID=A0A1H9E594_9PROT|nr:hypothetical protein SAMN05421510_102738 [Nitrosomonas ureae]